MKNTKRNYLKYVFVFLGILVLADVFLIFFSEDYRNIFGATNQITDSLWRIVPDFMMMVFYGFMYLKHENGLSPSNILLWHGVLFGLVGLAMCIPWGGYFFAPFSPIGLLYLVLIIWAPSGYFLSLCVAILFIVFNLNLIRVGFMRRNSQ